MKETPILFSAPMVRAILEGRKSQTRRIIKMTKDEIKDATWGYTAFTPPGKISVRGYHADGRYGESFIGQPFHVGDILWVRESWCHFVDDCGYTQWDQFLYKADGGQIMAVDADGSQLFRKDGTEASPWVSPLFMPKAAARIWLEITEVRVERIRDINAEDADSEGIERHGGEGGPGVYRDYLRGGWIKNPIASFHTLFEKINGPEPWQRNPWTWAVTFKVLSTTGKPQNL